MRYRTNPLRDSYRELCHGDKPAQDNAIGLPPPIVAAVGVHTHNRNGGHELSCAAPKLMEGYSSQFDPRVSGRSATAEVPCKASPAGGYGQRGHCGGGFLSGAVCLCDSALCLGDQAVNVHTTTSPSGAVRGRPRAYNKVDFITQDRRLRTPPSK